MRVRRVDWRWCATAVLATGGAACLPSYPGDRSDGGEPADATTGDVAHSMAATESGIADGGDAGTAPQDSGPVDGGPGTCGDAAVDARSDPANCGACGVVCPVACVDGGCLRAVEIAASAGSSTACAVISDGTVRCWGNNNLANLGILAPDGGAVPAELPTPSPVLGIAGATRVAINGLFGCAVVAGGAVVCWGQDPTGLEPDASLTARPIGNGSGSLTGATTITANDLPMTGASGCATVAGGLVYCWGSDGYGKLGDGMFGTSTNPPVQVQVSNAVDVSLMAETACAVIDGGTVSCWGGNGFGQLGNGTIDSTGNAQPLRPAPVSGLTGVGAIAGGSNHVCAWIEDGGVACWGDNYYGELGIGDAGGVSTTPVSVIGLPKAVAVSAGNDSTCAVIADGTVRCWGNGSYGELGNGAVAASSVPVEVTSVTGATQVAVGSGFACALLENGSVTCWGSNQVGELGNGTTALNPQPTASLVKW